MEEIKKILKANYAEGDIFYCHVSLINPRGKFQFDKQNLEKFWKAYCDLIYNNEDPIIGIAEKSQQYLPVLVDVDLKIRDMGQDIGEKLYNDEQLEFIIKTYQDILRQIVDNCSEEDLTCVVLEKKLYQENKNDIVYIKNGFHLHFPYIFLNKIDQEVHIIPRVQEKVEENKLFGNIGIENSGNVIDKVCCKVPWLLYGSKKSETNKAYKVTKIYDINLNEISLEKAFRNYKIYDDRDRLINIRENIKYYLPRILSILPFGRETKELRRGIICPIKEKMKREKKSSNNNHKALNLEESITLCKKYLPLISDNRASDRNDWMSIGWALFNITEGDESGLELWCEFSSRCEEKYDENVCVYQWERMTKKDSGLGIGTIKHYAKLDNPEEYKKLQEKQTERHIIESLDGSHNDIAKALYSDYGDEFLCASISNRVWFQFVKHRWEQIEDGVFLREKISSEIAKKYISSVKKLYDELGDCQDKNKSKMLQERIKQINVMVKNLKSAGYKNHVMIECCEVFYDPKFKEKLDANPYLIGFKNGVYDLKNNYFRPGRPEDYLSKFMPIDYVKLSEDDQKVQEVYTFLEQVFPDKSVRNYFLDVSSDIFVGGNHEKIVLFWTGEGDNGKSITQKFFDLMLGKLSTKLNTNIITGKKPSAGSAFADLARTGGGVRLAVLEEPDNDEMINAGIFKHLSGNDTFYARDLFEKGKDTKEIQPLFKLVFICNKLPRIKGADKAVFNRIRVIPFESTFCRPDNPAPETYEEQLKQKRFPMDKQFSKKIPNLVQAFAWILLEHRLKIANKPRFEPEKVRSATEIYRKQNDIFRQFMDENIIEDEKETISLMEIYSMYKEWFRDSFPNQTVNVKAEVEDYFIKAWGHQISGKKWKGYRFRNEQDDISSGNMVILTNDDLMKEEFLKEMKENN